MNLIKASGFSGHGFTFASVIGKILPDLEIKGKPDAPIEFLRSKRLKLSG
jgi:glycine/D-amino acid oxidase-like deaminating enzyme